MRDRGKSEGSVPKKKPTVTVNDLRFVVAASRVVLEKLRKDNPVAWETARLALALEKMRGARVAEA
jgi:hypothetical protein